MPESEHAKTLYELTFSKVEGVIYSETDAIKPGDYFHVPGQEVTYAFDETRMAWMSGGHVPLGHIPGFNAIAMPEQFLAS